MLRFAKKTGFGGFMPRYSGYVQCTCTYTSPQQGWQSNHRGCHTKGLVLPSAGEKPGQNMCVRECAVSIPRREGLGTERVVLYALILILGWKITEALEL